uniref:Reverse transcriptase domain-containing protein n=1 Tax=Amphimedon queenslandica TaxID=400682 RepID=A0A1X7VRK4_AMPQE
MVLQKKHLVTRLINPNNHLSLVCKGTKIASLSQLPHYFFVSEDVPTPLPKVVAEVKQKLLWNLAQQGQGLNDSLTQQLYLLLSTYADLFAIDDSELGRTGVIKHSIDKQQSPPVRIPLRRLPKAHQDKVTEMLQRMLQQKVIEPSQSPWSSTVVLAKKDGSVHFCVDYRQIINLPRKDAYPLPRIDETLWIH